MIDEAFPEADVLEIAGGSANDALIVELEGFEGPLDLLLSMARSQKVDLLKISVLKLADQYLAFVESVRRERLELAADYLVMAAWLTYLKSRLVLPQALPETIGAEEIAAQLRWRLARLQAMREASARLFARDLLNRDVFTRGQPEPVVVVRTRKHADTLYDLLSAYSRQRVRTMAAVRYEMPRPEVYLIEEARARLERMLGSVPEWRSLLRFLPAGWAEGHRRRTALASTFSAALELARDGRVTMRQMAPFGEIYLKDCVGLAGEDGA
jgi:segregation and condensation protein A